MRVEISALGTLARREGACALTGLLVLAGSPFHQDLSWFLAAPAELYRESKSRSCGRRPASPLLLPGHRQEIQSHGSHSKDRIANNALPRCCQPFLA